MKNRFSFNDAVPYIIIIALFYVITVVYFSPMLEGKRLDQGDIKKHIGGAKEIMDHREKYGEDPYWTNSMFGGMAAYLLSARYTSDNLREVGKIFRGFMPIPAGAVFLYMTGFFILMMVLGMGPWLSFLGAVAFAFSSYSFIILEAGHNTKALAIGFMAPVFAGMLLMYRGRYLAGAAITAIFFAFEVKANHPQITYYLMLIVLIYLIYHFIHSVKEKQLARFFKASGLFAAIVILGTLTHFTQLMTINEWGEVSIRGKSELTYDKENLTTGLDRDYATQWSYGRSETWSLLVPNFKGGASVPIGNDPTLLEGIDPQVSQNVAASSAYWGDQPFTSGPVYVGAIVLFLAVLGMFIVKGYFKWALFTATVFSILLAWGRNFPELTNFFLDYFPAYNKFRAVSMILVIAEFCIPILAVLAIKETIKNPKILLEKRDIKIFKISPLILSFLLTGGIAFLFFLMPSTFNNFEAANEEQNVRNQFTQQLQRENLPPEEINQIVNMFTPVYMNGLTDARKKIFRRDAIRSFGFVLVAGLLMFLFVKKILKPVHLISSLVIIILIDMWVINRRYLNNDHFVHSRFMEKPFTPTSADLKIMEDPDPNFRVLNRTVNTYNDASTSYFHKSIGGYHGAKLRRYQEMIDHHLNSNNFRLLDMLNMKYIIRAAGNGNVIPVPNPGALGHAWFVDGIHWVEDPDEEYVFIGDVVKVRTLSDQAILSVIDKPVNDNDHVSVYMPLNLSVAAMPDSVFTIKLTNHRLEDDSTYVFGSNPKDTIGGFVNIDDPAATGRVLPKHFEAEIAYRFNPEETAVIDRKWKDVIDIENVEFDTTAEIRLLNYKANHLTYAAKCSKPQLAVFSEIFYDKGWNAYLNGELVPHGRANWILRTMVIPEGEHTIEFKFEPAVIKWAEIISISAAVIVLLLSIGAGVYFWLLPVIRSK